MEIFSCVLLVLFTLFSAWVFYAASGGAVEKHGGWQRFLSVCISSPLVGVLNFLWFLFPLIPVVYACFLLYRLVCHG